MAFLHGITFLIKFSELVLGHAHLLFDHLEQRRVPGESGCEPHIPFVLGPVHELMAAEVAVPPQLDDCLGPALVKVLEDPLEDS